MKANTDYMKHGTELLGIQNISMRDAKNVILDSWNNHNSYLKLLNSDTTKKEKIKIRKDITNMPALYFYGAPGVGKSSVIMNIAKQLGIGCLIVSLGNKVRDDIAGIPILINTDEYVPTLSTAPTGMPVEDINGRVYIKDQISGETKLFEKGILFLDEFSSCTDDVFDAALTLIQERKVNNYNIPIGWMIVAAGNRRIDNENLREPSTAMRTRFSEYNIFTTLDDWLADFGAVYKNPRGEKIICDEIISFLKAFPQYFYPDDKLNDEKNKPFAKTPDPRSWATLGTILTNQLYFNKDKYQTIKDIPSSLLYNITAGCVGVVIAREFINFLKIIDTKLLKEIDGFLKDDYIKVCKYKNNYVYYKSSDNLGKSIYHVTKKLDTPELKKFLSPYYDDYSSKMADFITELDQIQPKELLSYATDNNLSDDVMLSRIGAYLSLSDVDLPLNIRAYIQNGTLFIGNTIDSIADKYFEMNNDSVSTLSKRFKDNKLFTLNKKGELNLNIAFAMSTILSQKINIMSNKFYDSIRLYNDTLLLRKDKKINPEVSLPASYINMCMTYEIGIEVKMLLERINALMCIISEQVDNTVAVDATILSMITTLSQMLKSNFLNDFISGIPQVYNQVYHENHNIALKDYNSGDTSKEAIIKTAPISTYIHTLYTNMLLSKEGSSFEIDGIFIAPTYNQNAKDNIVEIKRSTTIIVCGKNIKNNGKLVLAQTSVSPSGHIQHDDMDKYINIVPSATYDYKNAAGKKMTANVYNINATLGDSVPNKVISLVSKDDYNKYLSFQKDTNITYIDYYLSFSVNTDELKQEYGDAKELARIRLLNDKNNHSINNITEKLNDFLKTNPVITEEYLNLITK